MENNTIQPETVSPKQPQPEIDKKPVKISKTTIIIIVAIIALGVLSYVYKGLFIAATVNGSPISRLSIIQKLEKEAGKNLLDSLITEKLVQAEADAKKIVISNDEIDAEIKKIEDQVTAQGSTIDVALAGQGMTMDDLRTQIILQKEMEKLLADKVIVTDQEIAQYIKDNGIKVTKGDEAATNDQIRSELSSQKFSNEAQTLIADLKSKAKIQYFVNYK